MDEQVKESETKREAARIIAEREFQAIADKPEGRRFLRRILAECRVMHQCFNGDPQITAFNEGRRSIGLWLLDQFQVSPELYLQLLTDKLNDRYNTIDD
jgi:hypothetical protein